MYSKVLHVIVTVGNVWKREKECWYLYERDTSVTEESKGRQTMGIGAIRMVEKEKGM